MVVQLLTYIVAIDLSELSQQLLRPLVEQLGQHQPDLDDHIAAPAVPRRWNAAFTQAKPLT